MIGQTLSHFKVTAMLGKGGMGEVYRAEDSKLGREVAIKVLPEAVANDPERMARFEREAKVLASLNHPNIAAIYSIDSATAGTETGRFEDGTVVSFLVMELVEGETLQERIARGPVPFGEATPIALQIAQALEAAHENGIMHRDLKPANIKVDPDDQVKVLDFGLAKAFSTEPLSGAEGGLDHSPMSLSPTLTQQMTGAGVILGTAAYMSPEQAKGKTVDRRADIWAFGVVLFEMLSGQKLFRGETASETLATVMLKDPDWDLLPGNIPTPLRELLERCLVKEPKRRLRDIGDARIELNDLLLGKESSPQISEEPVASADLAKPRKSVAPLVGALALGALLGVLGMWSARGDGSSATDSPATALSKLSISIPEGLSVGSLRISPDGRTVRFYGSPQKDTDSDELSEGAYLRSLDDFELRFLEGSEAGSRGFDFSPDGQWAAFAAPSEPGSAKWQILKVPLDGSRPPVSLGDWSEEWRGGILWLPTDDLLVIKDGSPQTVMRIAAEGGPPNLVTQIDAGEFSGAFFLGDALPDGKHVLVRGESWEGGYGQSVGLLDLETGKARILIEDGWGGSWLPTGHLLFARHDTLLAAPFDLSSLVVGGPVGVMDGLRTETIWGAGEFDISNNGTLLFEPGGQTGAIRTLAIVDRDGNIDPWSSDHRAFEFDLTVSPSGRRLSVVIPNADGLYELWVSEFDQPRLTRLAADPNADCTNGVLSFDGQYLAYTVFNPEQGTKAVIRRFDGTDQPRILLGGGGKTARETTYRTRFFSPDGSLLLIEQVTSGEIETILLDLAAESSGEFQPHLLVEHAWGAEFSPDGRWIAYRSDTSGRDEIYLRRFLEDRSLGPEIPITTNGAEGFRWVQGSPPGDWEMIVAQDAKLFTTTLSTGAELRISKLEEIPALAAIQDKVKSWDVLPDGRFLVILEGDDEVDPSSINLILGFDTELQRLVPTH